MRLPLLELPLAGCIPNGYVKKHMIGDGPGFYYTLHKSCEHFRKRVMTLTKKHGPIAVVEPIPVEK